MELLVFLSKHISPGQETQRHNSRGWMFPRIIVEVALVYADTMEDERDSNAFNPSLDNLASRVGLCEAGNTAETKERAIQTHKEPSRKSQTKCQMKEREMQTHKHPSRKSQTKF